MSGPGRCDHCGEACLHCEVAYARDTWDAKRAALLEVRETKRHQREQLEQEQAAQRRERQQEQAAQRTELDQTFLELRLAGHTLDEIGARYGLTRERVRQRLDKFAPGIADEARRLRSEAFAQQRAEREKAAEQARQRRVQEQGVPCVTCGTLTLKTHADDQFASCSADCQRLFLALRNHFGRPALNGPNGVRLYIRPGSEADAAAIEAHRGGLPIFGLLPEAIRKQISGEAPRVASYHALYGRRAQPKRDPHPCGNCGKPTTNKQWCTRECWATRGSAKAVA